MAINPIKSAQPSTSPVSTSTTKADTRPAEAAPAQPSAEPKGWANKAGRSIEKWSTGVIADSKKEMRAASETMGRYNPLVGVQQVGATVLEGVVGAVGLAGKAMQDGSGEKLAQAVAHPVKTGVELVTGLAHETVATYENAGPFAAAGFVGSFALGGASKLARGVGEASTAKTATAAAQASVSALPDSGTVASASTHVEQAVDLAASAKGTLTRELQPAGWERVTYQGPANQPLAEALEAVRAQSQGAVTELNNTVLHAEVPGLRATFDPLTRTLRLNPSSTKVATSAELKATASEARRLINAKAASKVEIQAGPERFVTFDPLFMGSRGLGLYSGLPKWMQKTAEDLGGPVSTTEGSAALTATPGHPLHVSAIASPNPGGATSAFKVAQEMARSTRVQFETPQGSTLHLEQGQVVAADRQAYAAFLAQNP